jgi:hypothetical protein
MRITQRGYPALLLTGYGRPQHAARSITAQDLASCACHAHLPSHAPHHQARTVSRVTSLTKLQVPLGGQDVELQEIDFDVGAGALPLLRTRIREGKRFTVFDIDPATARAWGEALLAWAQRQETRDV